MRELFFQSGSHANAWAIVGWLVVVALAGRVALSWFSPGSPGAHAPRELAATWAASHVLGMGLLVTTATIAQRAGAALAWWLPVPVLALVFAARLATLPGAMVPRHAPVRARDPLVARALRLAAIAGLAWSAYGFQALRSGQASSPGFDVAAALAIATAYAALFAVAHALEIARAPAWLGAAGGVAVALVFAARGFGDEGGLHAASAACFLCGGGFLVPWLRRADRRALALATVSFAIAPGFAHAGLAGALAGLTILVWGTPRAARGVAVVHALLGLALAALAAWPIVARTRETPLAGLGLARPAEALPYPEWTSTSTQVLAAAFFLVVLLARWRALQSRGRTEPTTSGAPRGHEEAMLLRLVVGGMIAHLALERALARELGDPILPALLVLALVAALSVKGLAPVARES